MEGTEVSHAPSAPHPQHTASLTTNIPPDGTFITISDLHLHIIQGPLDASGLSLAVGHRVGLDKHVRRVHHYSITRVVPLP